MKLPLPFLPRFSGKSSTMNFADWVADAQALTVAAKLDQAAGLEYAVMHLNVHALQLWRRSLRTLGDSTPPTWDFFVQSLEVGLGVKILNGRHVSSLIIYIRLALSKLALLRSIPLWTKSHRSLFLVVTKITGIGEDLSLIFDQPALVILASTTKFGLVLTLSKVSLLP